MAQQYWIRQGPNVQGPFDLERVKGYVEQGRVRPDMQISTDGVTWRVGGDVSELFPQAITLHAVPPAPLRPEPSVPAVARSVARASAEPETDTCRYCGEQVRKGARKCKHCGEWILRGRSALREASRAQAVVQPRALVALVGAVLVVAGCLGTWIQLLGLFTVRGIETDHGKVMAIVGVIVGVAAGVALASRTAGLRWLFLIAGLATFGDGLRLLLKLRTGPEGITNPVERVVANHLDVTGWGLYSVVIGGLLLAVAGLLAERVGTGPPDVVPERGARGRSGSGSRRPRTRSR